MVILGHVLPPLLPPLLKISKNKILKNETICWRCHHFARVAKIPIIWIRFLRHGVRQTEFFKTLGHFLPFYHPHSQPRNNSKKSKFWTKLKKMSGDIILLYIHVCQKWTLYDIWFLRCKVWLKIFFVTLYHFLPFQPPNNSENQNSEIEKSTITINHNKWQSYDVWFLIYGAWWTTFFVNLDHILPFYLPPPPNNLKNEN